MPGQERIEELIDKAALDQFARLKEEADLNTLALERLIARGVELNKTFGGNIGFSKLVEDSKKLADSENQLEAQQKKLLAAQSKLLDVQLKQAKILKENELANLAAAKSEAVLEAAKLKTAAADEKKAIAAAKAASKNVQTEIGPTFTGTPGPGENYNGPAVTAGDMFATSRQLEAQKELSSEVNKSTAGLEANRAAQAADKVESEALAKAKKDLAFAQSEENVQLQGYKLQSAEANKAAKLEALEGLDLVDAYKKLQLQLAATRKESLALTAQYGVNSVEAGTAAAEVGYLEEQLKKIKNSVAIDSTTDQYKKLNIQAAIATAEFKSLASEFGVNSAQAAAAKKEAAALNAQILSIDKSIGQNQKNVGNYPNVANRAFSAVRKLAYILPGVGVAGIIGFATEPIIKFIGKLFEADEATEKLRAATKKQAEELNNLEDSFRDLGSVKDAALGASAGDLAKVNALTAVALDQGEAYQVRNRALKELADINKTYFGNLTLETASLQKLKTATQEYNEAIIQQAVIKELQADIGKVGAQYFRQLKIVQDLEKEHNKYGDILQDEVIKANAAGKAGQRTFIIDKSQDLRSIELAKQQKILQPLANQYNQLGKQIEDFTRSSLGFKPLDDKKTKESVTEIKAITEKFFADQLKDQAEQAHKLSMTTSLEYGARIAEAKKAAQAEQDIINGTADSQINNAAAKLQAVKNRTKKNSVEILNATNEFNKEVKDANQRRDLDLQTLAQKTNENLIQIQQTARGRQLEIDKEYNKDTIDNFNEAESKRLSALAKIQENNQNNLAIGKDIETDALNARYEKQLKAAKNNQLKIKQATAEYERDLAEIQYTAAVDSAKDQISIAEGLLAEDKKNHRDDLEDRRKLADAKNRLSDLEAKHELTNLQNVESTRQETIAKTLEIIDNVKQVVEVATTLVGGLIDASVTRQKNALQEQSDQIDTNTQHQIDAVNASTDSEQKKADKIAVINARAQAQKALIDQKQRQLDQEKARFDKINAITSIILNTAVAITKVLGNPFQVALVAALGAAQLAVAIATPIPKYKKGTNWHPGGQAWMGDGFKEELAVTPEGKMIVSDARPKLYDLPEGTVVYPDYAKMAKAGLKSAVDGIPRTKNENNEVLQEIRNEMRLTRQAIKNKKENHYNVNHRGFTALANIAGNWNEYIDDNIRF